MIIKVAQTRAFYNAPTARFLIIAAKDAKAQIGKLDIKDVALILTKGFASDVIWSLGSRNVQGVMLFDIVRQHVRKRIGISIRKIATNMQPAM